MKRNGVVVVVAGRGNERRRRRRRLRRRRQMQERCYFFRRSILMNWMIYAEHIGQAIGQRGQFFIQAVEPFSSLLLHN